MYRSPAPKNYNPYGDMMDQKGELLITRDIMAYAVESEKSEFPMDYDGTLADCSGIEINVENDIGLRARIDRLTEFYPDEAVKLRSLVAGSANQRFGSVSLKVETQPDGVMEVVLSRAGVEG